MTVTASRGTSARAHRVAAVWVLAIQLAATGCVHRLDRRWDGKTAPACTDEYGPVFGFGALSVIGFGVGVTAAAAGTDNNDTHTALAIGGVVVGAVAAGLAYISEEAIEECRTAKVVWRAGGGAGAWRRR